MIADINIGPYSIGTNKRTFVIAEAGVNHNGDEGLATELVRQAKNAGADCVKFQTFKAERVVTANAPKANYQKAVTDPNQSQLDMLRSVELSEHAYGDLVSLCKSMDIVFTSTPYNEEDIDFLNELGVPLLKSASIHIAEPRFLQRLGETGLPLVVSTGMAVWPEIYEAVDAIRATGNEQFVLLQCTTNYPSLLSDTHLNAMVEMGNRAQCLVGYSDHTQSHVPCLGAIALGACVVEKHFTLNNDFPGPDHSTSETPDSFAKLVNGLRDMEVALGNNQKTPTAAERANMTGMRRSIAVRCALPAGHVISDEDLTCKRPASGIAPREWSRLIGRRTVREIPDGSLLAWDDVSN
ncbi:MAG: N-acetylneuraminate synthase family protein [Alphaproteobacteria bacterium]|nr:N-acetylneuraminate synthase family protein [Alphaproteobacteria bacterium]